MKAERFAVQTKHLRITLMDEASVAALIAAETDAHMRQAYGEMLSGAQEHSEDKQWYLPWQMTLKSGKRVGDACFKGPPKKHAVEIGYGVDESHRRKGYATETVKALCDWAFAQEQVYYVEAEAEVDNEASIGVLGKCGFAGDGEGAEGHRYLLRKPGPMNMTLFMSLGLALGISLGSALGSTPLGLSLGMCFGLAIGAMLDADEKKKRAAADAERGLPPMDEQ